MFSLEEQLSRAQNRLAETEKTKEPPLVPFWTKFKWYSGGILTGIILMVIIQFIRKIWQKRNNIGRFEESALREVNPEGGMPTEMKQLARTFKGTASFTTEADTVTNFYSEEEPTVPVETVSSETGLKQVKLNFIEWDNDVLVEVFGGSIAKAQEVTIEGKKYTVDKFKAPRDVVQIEKALRVLTRYNVVIDIPRAKILARFIWNLAADQIAQIEITATAMSSASEEDGAYEIYKLGEPTA